MLLIVSHALAGDPGPAGRSAGGLRLTGRALVAVPQDAFSVFVTWRLLEQDGAAAFDVFRAGPGGAGYRKVGTAQATTAFRDQPGPGTYTYQVVPLGGLLRGARSNPFSVTTALRGRDWVGIMPTARGRRLQFSERHFADTDGDGELEFVTYYPQVPSYRGGTSPESYKLQVYRLFDEQAPRWTFDTGMGTQAKPASGDHRADWDYEWTFKPVAHDIDGDFKAEIITLARIALPGETAPRYRYVVLKDMGDSCTIIGALDSPIPVADGRNNSRHFPFFAGLGGTNDSFVLQGGTYGYWEMWAYDWNGRGFDLRWHVKSTEPGFKGNVSSSHTVLVMDLDGDGRDEINNGLTVLDDDGSVLWSGNVEFGATNHVDGQVIDDIHPGNPGLELMTHTEQGNRYALYDARSGRLLWQKEAPGRHLQLNIAAHVTGGGGLDIVGVTGGHRALGAFACAYDGTDLAYPYSDRPINGDRWWPMDWDGGGGHNVCLNFDTVYGLGTNVLFRMNSDDAPAGDVIPWSGHVLHRLWFNVDLVGDYREDIPVQMKDGSIRVYLNTRTPPARRVCKWQNRTYQMLQAPGDYRYFIAAIEPQTSPRRGAKGAEAGP
jgi:hypothetical protein